jgi:hypothetical protein
MGGGGDWRAKGGGGPTDARAIFGTAARHPQPVSSLQPSKLSMFCVFAVIAGVQFAAAATSPWLALATAIALGVSGGAATSRLGLRFSNPWLMVGLAMLGCLAGVLAAIPVMAEPQWVSASSPSAALFAGIGRVLIGLRRKS